MKIFIRNLNRESLTLIGMGLVFGISRMLYSLSGVQFDTGTVTRNWHFIDTQLLINDLWRSVFYMHTQPPLMNLLTGINLQLFPESWELVARIVFLLGGYLLMLST